MAEEDLSKATAALQTVEREIGPDLVELRVMTDSGTGDGTLRRRLNEVAAELRQANSIQATESNHLQQLLDAQNDPGQLAAAHNQLIAAFPTLKRLKDGLVDAQLRTAQLQGVKSDEHPDVLSALIAEQKVHVKIRAELAVAIRGMRASLDIASKRVAELESQIAQVNARLADLADLRAPYSRLVAEVESRTEFLESERSILNRAQATKEVATNVSFLTRVEEPVLSAEPMGPGRVMIAGISVLAGLATGLGLIFLFAVPQEGKEPSRGVSSSRFPATGGFGQSRLGRRASDFFRRRAKDGDGRRQSDGTDRKTSDEWPRREQATADPRAIQDLSAVNDSHGTQRTETQPDQSVRNRRQMD